MPSVRIPNGIGTRDARNWVSNPSLGAMTWLSLRRQLKYLPMIGSLTASIVHPREVYKSAILSNSASIICGHNHPSTDCQPSREDRAITTRLVECGKLLGIPLI